VIELLAASAGLSLEGLIDDIPGNADHAIANLRVIGSSGDLERLAREGIEAVALGFGAGRGRAAVVDRVLTAGLALPTLVHRTAIVALSAELGAGCQVLPGALIGPGTRLGRGSLVNTGAIVEHDCVLEDGAVVYSGAVLAGRVTVGSDAEIGAGATVAPDVRLGAGCRVGAGAAVIADVPNQATAVGVPARVL
jgi:sugar O-acyltransferase (sialic acid O-acetyltransferase NeuD family)